MQRWKSMATMPSSRLKVACVGHTRTQAGSSQWLQSTMAGAARRGEYSSSWPRKAWSKVTLAIQRISWRGSGIVGTLWAWWQAAMHLVQLGWRAHAAVSTAMAQRVFETAATTLLAAAARAATPLMRRPICRNVCREIFIGGSYRG